MSESLYFIAVVPPLDIQERIIQLKEEVVEKFGSKHALNAPAHITMHMPFKWKDKRFNELAEIMRQLNEDFMPFKVQLKDFGFFDPRVVYVDVVANEQLSVLQGNVQQAAKAQLKLTNANYKDQVFHPHMTIAFRDLKKAAFFEAKAYYTQQTFSAHFKIQGVDLLRHDGKMWRVIEKQLFSKNNPLPA
jgi:2'-5' RNA ligase